MVKLIETLELWSVFKGKTSEETLVKISVQCGTPLVKKREHLHSYISEERKQSGGQKKGNGETESCSSVCGSNAVAYSSVSALQQVTLLFVVSFQSVS